MIVDGVPLYRQIKADLLEQIKSGQLAPGERIESELELMARYGVSRATVRQARGPPRRAAPSPARAGRAFPRRRLYDPLLADYGVRPARAHEVFEPVLLTTEEASLLGKHRGDPALVIARTALATTVQ